MSAGRKARLLRGLLLLCMVPACGADPADTGGRDAAAPSRGDDGSVDPAVDASTSDGGAVAPHGDAGSAGEYYDPSGDALESLANCFDGVDDDENGARDCDDHSCRQNVPACCVGVSAAVCCEPSDPVDLPIAACRGEVAGCTSLTALAEPFGSPQPTVDARGELEAPSLVPRGQASDSGLLARAPIDLRAQAVTIRASIAAGGARHELGTDFVAVGLVDAESAAELVRVAPLVAMVVSGNRHELGLLIAGELVLRWPLASADFHEYTLSARPDGTIELASDGARLGEATLPIDRPLRPVVYGRSFNPAPGDPPPVRLASLRIVQERCDTPSALSASATPVLPAPGATGWEGVRHVGAPSIARYVDALGEPEQRMAVEIDGAIYIARLGASGWELTSALGAPALAAADWAEQVGDPALRWDGSALELFFTATREGGAGSIARVRAAEGAETFAWADVEVILEPSGATTSVSDPAVFVHSGAEHLALREDLPGGSRIALYRLADLSREGIVRERGADLFAFDRDEVGAPSVVVTDDGVLRMYFMGRRGTRYGVGVLVSPDGARWTEPSGGALVLDASGAGFDALGVLDPEPVIDGEAMRLFYTGLDGSVARVGLAVGPAPPTR